MEADNEAIEPTRSLFGGPVVPTTAPDAEDSTVATDTVDSEPAETEEVNAEADNNVVEPTVAEETVSDEPEQTHSEPQETESNVEVVTETVEPTTVEEVPVDNIADDAEQTVEKVQEEHKTEDAVLEPVEQESEQELPEIARLKAEREKLDEAIQSKQLEERKSVISQIAAVVKLYDIPLLDLFKSLGGVPNPRKGEKAPITHRDDQGNTWTGRGRTPRWLKDKNPDDYRV